MTARTIQRGRKPSVAASMREAVEAGGRGSGMLARMNGMPGRTLEGCWRGPQEAVRRRAPEGVRRSGMATRLRGEVIVRVTGEAGIDWRRITWIGMRAHRVQGME